MVGVVGAQLDELQDMLHSFGSHARKKSKLDVTELRLNYNHGLPLVSESQCCFKAGENLLP